MRPALRTALTIALLVLGLWFYETMRPVRHPAGVLAPDPPAVEPLAGTPQTFERDGHVLSALARFSSHARVLSLDRYSLDRAARVAPFDIALGWGPLSDSARLKLVDVAQTERGIVFKSYDPEFADERVQAHLLNLHVIAADASIQTKLSDLRTGNVVRLEGWLVEARADDGWRWKGDVRAASPSLPGSLLWLQKLEVE